ncbi:hypothetical protein D3C87_2037890 [compost metagenome]
MPVRAAGDDNHVVSQRRFSGNVDGDDIFSFGILEADEDGFQSTGSGIGATFRTLRDNGERFSLGVYCCQCFPFPGMTNHAQH